MTTTWPNQLFSTIRFLPSQLPVGLWSTLSLEQFLLVLWISLIRLQFCGELRHASCSRVFRQSFINKKNLPNKSCISWNMYLEGIKAFIAIIKDCFSHRRWKIHNFYLQGASDRSGQYTYYTLDSIHHIPTIHYLYVV